MAIDLTWFGLLRTQPANERLKRPLPEELAEFMQWHDWHPGPRLSDRLPSDWAISVKEQRHPSQPRCFSPASNVNHFIQLSANAGLEILSELRGDDAELRRGYREMFLVFQIGRERSSFYDIGFNSRASLKLRPSRRPSPDQANVLPPLLGVASDGSGQVWDVAELIRAGRAKAQDFGYENATEGECIQFGLYAAAELNPLAPVETNIVRDCLMAEVDSLTADEDIVEEVNTRLLEAMESRLNHPADRFRNWYSSTGGTLVAQIARWTRRCGVLEPAVVRAVLMDRTWDSYTYVAQCIDLQMRSLEQQLPQRLAGNELELFQLMFCTTSQLDQIPLVLLADRFKFLNPGLKAIMRGTPVREVVPVLRRVLSYYSWMAHETRQADRRPAVFSSPDIDRL